MQKYSPLTNLMSIDLPNRTYQKRLQYRTTTREVKYLYNLLNVEVFNNSLKIPTIEVVPNCRKYWGICIANFIYYKFDTNGKSNCTIRLMDKWFCKQWLIATLAHEMCHQYQWDILGPKRIKQGMDPLMSHGPSFFIFREKLNKFGIPLKRSLAQRRWFVHQDMFKC